MAMSPPLAPLSDFEERLGRTLAGVEQARAAAALADASAIVRLEAGKTWVTDGQLAVDVPDAIVTVVLACARRVFDNPDGLTSESLGSYAAGMANPTADVYLKASERAIIAKVVADVGNFGGIGTLGTTRGPLETTPVLDDWCDSIDLGGPIALGATVDLT